MGIGLLSATLYRAAFAQTPSEPIRIEYEAAAGCPSASEFADLVFQRTTTARRALPDEAARVFKVQLEPAGKRFRGTLVVQEEDGEGVARQVTGNDCGQVASVIALASALAIDPNAQLAAGSQEDENEAANPSGGANDAPPPPEAGRESFVPPTDYDFTDPPDPIEAPKGAWLLGVSAGPMLSLGIAPEVAFGGGLEVETRRAVAGFPESIGLQLSLQQSPKTQIESASADFEFLLARPSMCFLRLPSQQEAPLRACLHLDLGLVTARGFGTTFDETAKKLWVAGGTSLRWDVPISAHWFVAFEGTLATPLTRHRFVFRNPDTNVYDVPVISGGGGIRLGLTR